MTEAPAILAQGVGKRFATARGVGVAALEDVSFDLPKGAALAVVGENGSGKSTLLDVLLGMTRPSAGVVRVEEPVSSLLELGAGFFHELSGRDNAVHMALLVGASREAARDLARRAGGAAPRSGRAPRPPARGRPPGRDAATARGRRGCAARAGRERRRPG